MTDTKSTTKRSQGGSAAKFTADERAAMKERARELKASGSDGEGDLRAKIAEMPEPDRSMAERIHEIVTQAAPDLAPRTYYGMPAYAKGGKVICFFQPKSKFKVRYSTFGFQPEANLDEGSMWPTSFALAELTPETETRLADLVNKAVS
jgi:uncharacterized protein YdhG (YjbR/CyaY superfamily)